jgi:pimeloyl-ACP methyl ester carboxylesterase
VSERFPIHGHEIAWESRGEGKPIVFLHGLASARGFLIDACEPVLAPLGRHRRVYVDLPGHGESKGHGGSASADDLAAALAILVGEIAPGAALVGHSYGGYLVQGLLRDRPDAAGAMMICPVVEPDFGRRRVPPRRAIDRAELAFADDAERLAFEEVAVVQSAAALDRFRASVYPANLAADRIVVALIRERYAMARTYVHALPSYDRPVSIVCGRDDHWSGFEDAVTIVRALPAASLAVVPGCGPLLPFEAPGAFARLLVEWVDRL